MYDNKKNCTYPRKYTIEKKNPLEGKLLSLALVFGEKFLVPKYGYTDGSFS